MRNFDTGATRNDDGGKPDFEGFLHPSFVIGYGDYMHEHRLQADGTLRDSDNWQKGIPKAQYLKSLLRHVIDLWALQRGVKRYAPEDGHLLTVKELCMAILFNVQGYFLESEKE